MKKIIAVLAVVASVGVYAQNQTMDHSAHQNMGNTTHQEINHSAHSKRGGMMMDQVNNLTPEQQEEFNELHSKHRVDMQRSMLNIKEINLEIQRELTAEKPNEDNINRLIDEKAKLQADNQKEMLKFKVGMKEKFGIEMMGKMMNGDKNCNMMGKRGSKGMKGRA